VHAQAAKVSQGAWSCGGGYGAAWNSHCVPEVPVSAAYPVVGSLVLAGYVLYSRRNRHSVDANQA